MTVDLQKDGNQEEPDCRTCAQHKFGYPPLEDKMICHHGAYRGTGERRITYPYGTVGIIGATNWCPRRLRNSRCTCGKCPECILFNRSKTKP